MDNQTDSEFLAHVCAGFLLSVFDDVEFLVGGDVPGIGPTYDILIALAVKDGRKLTALIPIDMVLFLWRFHIICPVYVNDRLTFWCTGFDTGGMEEPFPIMIHFKEVPELLELFELEETV